MRVSKVKLVCLVPGDVSKTGGTIAAIIERGPPH